MQLVRTVANRALVILIAAGLIAFAVLYLMQPRSDAGAGVDRKLPTLSNLSSNRKSEGTTICHYTGDKKRPYRRITVSDQQLRRHRDHEKDIIPAPESGCPGPYGSTS
jgi:hypothetical protein